MLYPLNCFLFFLFLFYLFYHFNCVSSEQEYGFCETIKFKCGNIEAGFPFWGGNRPPACGRASLELRCNNIHNITSLNISNSIYNVLQVNQSSNSLRLVRADFSGSFCSAAFNSTTLPPEISDLLPIYKSLTVYYHCNPQLHYYASHTCPGNNVISAYENPNYQRSCQDNFTVNVPTSFIPHEKELNMNHLESVLRKGFEVKVNTDYKTCEGCSSSPSESYRQCSQPFPCGDQRSLMYPFWVRSKQNCGHPDFEVDCSGGFPELNFSSVKFRILEANYTSRIIKVSRLDYKKCLKDPPNARFPESVLPIAPHTEMLTIYYGCENVTSLNHVYFNDDNGELVCYDDSDSYQRISGNIGPTANYYVKENISSPLLDSSCRGNIPIPMSGTVLNTLRPNNLNSSLDQGYELILSQDCSTCMDSKGVCGYNQTAGGFLCYCNDGTYGNYCGSKQKSHGTWVKPIRIFSGSVGGIALFVVLVTLSFHFLRMRKRQQRHQNLKALIPLEHYSYAQVKRITKSFAEVVGKGGFGIVYRGTLCDGRMVAVKVLKDSQGNGEDFINEVASMSRTSHLNIVSLLGFCAEGSKRAIIYEFLGNGSLDKFISGKTSVNLDCTTLYKIALGVARGLEYLHHGCKTRIVHFDVKPQNVLLDENFCPKVSDFGLAKLCEKKESILSLLDTRGTVGYIAPEMISRVYGNVSHKSDVYSYGMLVLDMVGARNKENANQASTSNTSSMYFPEWVYRDLELGNSGKHIENRIDSEDNELVKKMTLVGLWCIQPSPPDRPPMNRVVEMMEGNLDALEVPPRPQIPTVHLQDSSIFSEDTSVYTEG